MAKKIAKVPLGEDFLAGYKPVTPDFADIPMDNDVAPDPMPGPKGVDEEPAVEKPERNRGSGVVPWQGANHNIRLTRYVI